MNYGKLQEHQLFKSLSIDDIKNIISNFQETIYDKNQTIFNEGDCLEDIYLIVEGEAEIHNYDFHGNKVIIAVLKEYDIFGESVALSKEKISPYTVHVLKESKILKINTESFKLLLAQYPLLMMNMLELLASKNTYLTFKIEILSKKNIRDRVIEVLKYYYRLNNKPTFKLPFNKTRFADFIGINRTALETQLSKMISESLFTYENKVFTLSEELIQSFE